MRKVIYPFGAIEMNADGSERFVSSSSDSDPGFMQSRALESGVTKLPIPIALQAGEGTTKTTAQEDDGIRYMTTPISQGDAVKANPFKPEYLLYGLLAILVVRKL